MVDRNFNINLEDKFDYYFKKEGIFKFWKKDIFWSGKSFGDILIHIKIMQEKRNSSDSYYELNEVKTKKDGLIYVFDYIPGHGSSKKCGRLPSEKYFVKVISRSN